MKITFLLQSAFGMGGTIRATLTLANELARRHEVEIITVARRRDEPFFDIDNRVRVRTLMDLREGASTGRLDAVLGRYHSRLVPRQDNVWSSITLRGDYRLWQALRTLNTDVLITTRPAFNLLAARFAARGVVVVGQEHLHLGVHNDGMRKYMRRWYPRLAALVTLTSSDGRAYVDFLAEAPQVSVIPNAFPDRQRPLSRLDAPVVAAAGRMTPVKHYERLIRAFAKVAAQKPDWILRLYGDGPKLGALRALVAEQNLNNNIVFMGRTRDVEAEFAKASIVAISSSFEGFGMTIIEAFSVGVPVVSFDCPQGPGEIITHGHDGLLVPRNDVDALADALLELINDPDKRHVMGDNARRSAGRYAVTEISAKWEQLLADLLTHQGTG